jgi:hypothetical protein
VRYRTRGSATEMFPPGTSNCGQASLPHLPASVTTVSLRSVTAGHQEGLLLYCGEGKDPRFGVIDFASGADVTEALRAAVRATAESE